METWKPNRNLIKAIVDLLQLLGVEHEGGVSHQVLGSLDIVVLVTREDLEHPADDSDNLQGLHLGRGDVLGLLNQQAEVDRGGDNQQEHQTGVHGVQGLIREEVAGHCLDVKHWKERTQPPHLLKRESS